MDRDKLRRIIRLPEVIEGVHNYCDRWCERCPFTRRCSVFLMEEAEGMTEHVENPEVEPPGAEESFAHVADMFALTAQMIREEIEADGGDWEEFVAEAEAAPQPRRRKAPPFILEAKRYARAGMKWLGNSRAAVGEHLEKLAAEAASEEDAVVAEAITEALEILGWHVTLISVKFQRALGDELDDWNDAEDALARDRSAKVALLSLDASITAWEILRRVPAVAKDALAFRIRLQKIRRAGEAFFPGARGCARPGFDDPRFAELVRQFKGS